MIRGSRSTGLAFIMFFNIRLLRAGFALQLMTKDVSIASDIITQNGYSLPLTDDLVTYLKEALHHLGESPDHTEIYRHLEWLSDHNKGH